MDKSGCKVYKDIQLQTHQEFVVDFMNKTLQKGLILYHSVGSGKTILAITIARCMIENKNKSIKKAIVLAPKSVVPQWRAQFEKLGITAESGNFVVESHEQWLNKYSNGSVSAHNALLIVDEAHKFRTKITFSKSVEDFGEVSAGKYSFRLLQAAGEAQKVLFLTATPMVNGPDDIRNMLIAIDGKVSVETGYKDKFRKLGDVDKFKQFVECKFSHYANNQTADFPNTDIYVKQLFMDEEYYSKYELIEKDQIKELKEKDIEINFDEKKSLAVFLNGIRRAVNNIDKHTISPKVQWLIEQLQVQQEYAGRSIVYSGWRSHGVDLVTQKLTELKIPFAEITGDTSLKERKNIVDLYNASKLPVLMITAAGSEGLDLKETRNVYVLEPHWNQTRVYQTIGRAVRYKSHENLPEEERKVNVYFIVLSKPVEAELGSADEFMLKLSLMKQEVIEDVYSAAAINNSIEKKVCNGGGKMAPIPKGVVKLASLTWSEMAKALSIAHDQDSPKAKDGSNPAAPSNCSKVVTIPQFTGTCWWNAVMMTVFNSEGMRKLVMSKMASWKKTDPILNIFATMLKEHYTHENFEHMEFFKKTTPKQILAIMHQHAPTTFEMNPSFQEGYFAGRYLHKVLHYMGVTKLAILDAIQIPKTQTFQLFYGQYNAMQMVNGKKVYSKHDEDTVINYLEETPDVLMIITKKQGDLKFYPDYYYHSDQEFKPEIKYNGKEYIVDGLVLANYNTTCGGHEIAGITCNGQRHMYNGWLGDTLDKGMKEKVKSKVPCPLMKYDWIKQGVNSFCIDTAKCRLHFGDKTSVEGSQLCFNFSRGSRIYTYIRKDKI